MQNKFTEFVEQQITAKITKNHLCYPDEWDKHWEYYPIEDADAICIDLHFTDEQYETISNVFPYQLYFGDTWIHYFEDDWLYCLHSSTHYHYFEFTEIYKAKLNKEPEGYSIMEFYVRHRKKKTYDHSTKGLYTGKATPKLNKFKDELIDLGMKISFIKHIARYFLMISSSQIYPGYEADTTRYDYLVEGVDMMNQKIDYEPAVKSVLLGVAVGDALGVPVEFRSREEMNEKYVTDMIGGHGTTHNQPAGTWSDDSSLTFCLAEALTHEFDLNKIGQNFVKWKSDGWWTPYGRVFDIGVTTAQAIRRLITVVQPDLAGDTDERSNGNGSLMRIMPLLFYLLDKLVDERFRIVKQVSSITHRHIRSVVACFYYLEFARRILRQRDKFRIYRDLQKELPAFLASQSVDEKEIARFDRLLNGDISKCTKDEINSSGYVIDTLEASIWCLLTTGSYEASVLQAVNLGKDTDTTAAVTGGLAGLLYGLDNIPEQWLKQLARYDDINDLAERLAVKIKEGYKPQIE
jgi:ADP-ribosylglycohydrolase